MRRVLLLVSLTGALGGCNEENVSQQARLQEYISILQNDNLRLHDEINLLRSQLMGQQYELNLQGEALKRYGAFSAVVDLDDQGDVLIHGANLRIVNGTGKTDAQVNGRGNLILGYDEVDDDQEDIDRSGSHNLVIGASHTYSSYTGIVAGYRNAITGPSATVLASSLSRASGAISAVVGGHKNTASGALSATVGGIERSATEFGETTVESPAKKSAHRHEASDES